MSAPLAKRKGNSSFMGSKSSKKKNNTANQQKISDKEPVLKQALAYTENSCMAKYQTSWRRYFALIIDGLIFKPLEWINKWIFSSDPSELPLFIWLTFSSLAIFVYSVAMHAAFGQTVGKMITKVKVLDISEGKLSYKQAIRRDIVPILCWPISIYASYQASYGGLEYEKIFASPMFKIYIDILLGWIILEMITMLFNKKRRSFHDFISGSVVVKVT